MEGEEKKSLFHGLPSNGLPSENKSLVFVKLTDSSFKAIEEYLRIKVREAQFHTNWTKEYIKYRPRAPPPLDKKNKN